MTFGLRLVAALVLAGAGLADEVSRALELQAHERVLLTVPTDPGQEFQVSLSIEGRSRLLFLERVSLRSPDFQLLVQGKDGRIRSEAPEAVVTYRGSLLDEPGSRVAASLIDGRLEACLWTMDGTFGLQSARTIDRDAGGSEYILYRQEDVLAEARTCGVLDSVSPHVGAGGGTYGSGIELCEIAFDADVQFYVDNGSSLAASVADIEQILNLVDVIFERDVDVTFAITTIVVRTAEPDPYSTGDAGDLLEQFVDEWNDHFAFVRRDVAHLMTGKNLDGSTIGIAYLARVCDMDLAYGLSASTFNPNITSRVALTAHELGHNFGASHCDGSSPCRIMCASLGGCSGGLTSFAAVTRGAIADFLEDIDCLVPEPVPLVPPFFDPFASTVIDSTRWPIFQGAVTSTAGIGEPSGGRSLNLDSYPLDDENGDDFIVSNRILLAGAAPGQYLRYHVQHRGVEAGEELVAEYLDGAGVWKELERVVSNGVDQTAFELHELPLPGSAYHDDFRVRFRTEVTDFGDDWFLDDIAVDDQPLCPVPENYCTATANSFSPLGAAMSFTGTTSVGANDLVLFGSNAAVNQVGIFYYGPQALEVPLGNGFRCVGGVIKRLPLVTTDSFGFASFALDLGDLPPGGDLLAGDTTHFQFWFRDPAAGGAAFDLSDGLRVTFCP